MNDLTEITEYIARDSPFYAARFADRACEAARTLADFSGRGHLVREVNDPNVRQIIVGNYRLIYRVSGEAVFIQAIIHGARDLEKALEGRRPV